MHTYDAELTVHATSFLPQDVALDGVEDFLMTCNATTSPWPHEPATVDYVLSEGRAYRLFLSGDGARAESHDAARDDADVAAHASASDTVLFMYGRKRVDEMPISGDLEVFERLIAWVPE